MSYIWGVQITCQVARSQSSTHQLSSMPSTTRAARTVIVTGQNRSPEISRCSIRAHRPRAP